VVDVSLVVSFDDQVTVRLPVAEKDFDDERETRGPVYVFES
jgi:hypothetical protein